MCFFLFLGKLGQLRIETVNFLECEEHTHGMRLVGVVALTVVEVAEVVGSHNNVVTEGRGLESAVDATPAHDHGVGRYASFEYLIPADHLAAVRCDGLV